jgi:hypothetical protein
MVATVRCEAIADEKLKRLDSDKVLIHIPSTFPSELHQLFLKSVTI